MSHPVRSLGPSPEIALKRVSHTTLCFPACWPIVAPRCKQNTFMSRPVPCRAWEKHAKMSWKIFTPQFTHAKSGLYYPNTHQTICVCLLQVRPECSSLIYVFARFACLPTLLFSQKKVGLVTKLDMNMIQTTRTWYELCANLEQTGLDVPNLWNLQKV